MKFEEVYRSALENGKVEARLWMQDEHTKVLVVAGPKGASMKEHRTPYQTNLILVRGSIKYISNGDSFPEAGMEFPIPPEMIHEISFLEDAVFLLVQQKTKP